MIKLNDNTYRGGSRGAGPSLKRKMIKKNDKFGVNFRLNLVKLVNQEIHNKCPPFPKVWIRLCYMHYLIFCVKCVHLCPMYGYDWISWCFRIFFQRVNSWNNNKCKHYRITFIPVFAYNQFVQICRKLGNVLVVSEKDRLFPKCVSKDHRNVK